MAAEPERVGDASDEVEDMEDEEETAATDIKSQILRRPDLLAALQGQLHQEMLQVSNFGLRSKNCSQDQLFFLWDRP